MWNEIAVRGDVVVEGEAKPTTLKLGWNEGESYGDLRIGSGRALTLSSQSLHDLKRGLERFFADEDAG